MEFAPVISLVRRHLGISCFILLLFTPPVFRTLVFFTPLLVSTALCVLALVSLGPHLALNESRTKKEKIDHLREQGVYFPCEDWDFENEVETGNLDSTDDIKTVSMIIKFECDSEEQESKTENGPKIEDGKDCETSLCETMIPESEQECWVKVDNADQKSPLTVEEADDHYSQPRPTCSLENGLASNYDKVSALDHKHMITTECQNADTTDSSVTPEELPTLNACEGNFDVPAVQLPEEICKGVSCEVILESCRDNRNSCIDPSSERIACTSEEDNDSTCSSSCISEASQQGQNLPVLPGVLQEDRCPINNNGEVGATDQTEPVDVLSSTNNVSNRDPATEVKQISVERSSESPSRVEQAPDQVRIQSPHEDNNGREQYSDKHGAASHELDGCSSESTSVSQALPFGDFAELQDDVACLHEWVLGYQSSLDPWESSLWVGNKDSSMPMMHEDANSGDTVCVRELSDRQCLTMSALSV